MAVGPAAGYEPWNGPVSSLVTISLPPRRGERKVARGTAPGDDAKAYSAPWKGARMPPVFAGERSNAKSMGSSNTSSVDLADHLGPDLRPAWKELSLKASPDKIVLINPDLGPMDHPFRNLLRREPSNRIVWVAELPDPLAAERYDSYVEIAWEGDLIAANSWTGYYVLIDPETGRIRSGEFVK